MSSSTSSPPPPAPPAPPSSPPPAAPEPPAAAAAAPDPAEPPDLEPYRIALRKRGFRQDDPYLHECPKCGTSRAVEKWVVTGKGGGRDIDLCGACGETWSWRQRPMREDREIDPTFDLKVFLKM